MGVACCDDLSLVYDDLNFMREIEEALKPLEFKKFLIAKESTT